MMVSAHRFVVVAVCVLAGTGAARAAFCGSTEYNPAVHTCCGDTTLVSKDVDTLCCFKQSYSKQSHQCCPDSKIIKTKDTCTPLLDVFREMCRDKEQGKDCDICAPEFATITDKMCKDGDIGPDYIRSRANCSSMSNAGCQWPCILKEGTCMASGIVETVCRGAPSTDACGSLPYCTTQGGECVEANMTSIPPPITQPVLRVFPMSFQVTAASADVIRSNLGEIRSGIVAVLDKDARWACKMICVISGGFEQCEGCDAASRSAPLPAGASVYIIKGEAASMLDRTSIEQRVRDNGPSIAGAAGGFSGVSVEPSTGVASDGGIGNGSGGGLSGGMVAAMVGICVVLATL